MKKFLVILFLLSATFAWADDNNLLLDEANKLYSQNEYQQAATLYQKVIDSGFESSELYYNLGNTYFKLDDMPRAILYYEKARKLAPGDDDIQFNLTIANNRIVDKIETVPEAFYVRWWENLVYAFSLDTWGWISLTAFGLTVLMLLVFLLSNIVWIRKTGFWSGIVFLILFGISFLLAQQKHTSFSRDHQAIVFTPTVTIKSSPTDSSIDLFVIHEGTKVQLTDHVGDWYEIEIANGSVGWLKEEDIRKI
ncbi:MAG: tetratricopeptide repeat protein [Clostridia bacterium]|nr:tetratricopeptide repeat protein [Clostridia bacterium]